MSSVALRLIVVAVAGWLLVMPPSLPITPGLIFGLPVTALYLLIVWLGLIVAAHRILAASRGAVG